MSRGFFLVFLFLCGISEANATKLVEYVNWVSVVELQDQIRRLLLLSRFGLFDNSHIGVYDSAMTFLLSCFGLCYFLVSGSSTIVTLESTTQQ